MGYRIVRQLARALLGLFYHRVEVVGREHIPARGPLIVAANHHNSLVDPLLLLATVPRRLVALAKAPLFRHPLIGPFLRMVGALPVHRRQEAGTDPSRNDALFDAVTRTLRAKGGILIFPEGVTQPEPVLMTIRTGAARMLLAAEVDAGDRLNVALLPVGLVFHEPGTFRTGWALSLVGPPVPTGDCVTLYRTEPEAAVRPRGCARAPRPRRDGRRGRGAREPAGGRSGTPSPRCSGRVATKGRRHTAPV